MAPPEPRAARAQHAVPARVAGLVLLLAAVLAYLPALRGGFVWDDDDYVTQNPCLTRGLEGLRELWIPGHTPQYYPAVFTTFWIERALWGLDPRGYHALNVLLHALNALLVWRLARALGLRGAWLLAALFALHPVHVESVAWVTERKNVLSALFWLLAALAYLRFDERREAARALQAAERAPPWRWYAASLALFALALFAKTVTCSLPAALVLMLLWRRQRLGARRLVPLAPFFALGLALALHTAHLERTHVGAEGADFAFGASERLRIAAHALLFYPRKLLVPWPLSFIYPRWDPATLAWWPVAALLLAALGLACAWRRGRRGPALALAFFAGSLVPALGFFDVYPMRYSFVADHFQYLASLGVLALVAAAGAALHERRPALARGAGAAALAALGVLTWRQCGDYASEDRLWQATLARNPAAWIAHNNLAESASRRGDDEQARRLLEAALELPAGEKARDQMRFNLALVEGKLGRYEEALALLRRVQAARGGVLVRIAQTLERLGREDEAEATYRAALEEASRPLALVPFALHWLRLGRPADALPLLRERVAAAPEDTDAWMFLADAAALTGRRDEADASAARALSLARARGDAAMAAAIERRRRGYAAEPAGR